MNIRFKSSIIAIFCIILFLIILGISMFYISEKSFLKLEDDQLLRNLERLKESINLEYERLNSISKDWGEWNDMVLIANDKNKDLIEEHLNYDSLSNIDINTMIILNKEKEIIFAGIINNEKNEVINNDKFLIESFTYYKRFLYLNSIEPINGIIIIENKTYLVSSANIINPEYPDIFQGKIIITKIIDNSFTKKIEKILKFDIKIYEYNEEYLKDLTPLSKIDKNSQKILGNAILDIDNKADILIKREKEFTNGYLILNDFNEKPSLILKFIVPRTVYLERKNLIRTFNILLVLIGIFSSAFVLITNNFYLKNTLFQLKYLKNYINKYSNENKEFDIKNFKKDEIGELAFEFNNLIQKLNKAKDEQEDKIKIRTQELLEKNKELEKFNKLSIGREIEMIKLKKENMELKEKLKK